MSGIYLLLGTNQGERLQNLSKALNLLNSPKMRIRRHSSIWESEPWGITEQPWFLNMVVEIDCDLEPYELLDKILMIEQELGRRRSIKWGPRIIDIDILYFKNKIVNSPDLTIPHPGIAKRKFTLLPLAELEPDLQHPILNKNQTQLLLETDDASKCIKSNVVIDYEFS